MELVKLFEVAIADESTAGQTKADADFLLLPCQTPSVSLEQTRQQGELLTATGLPSKTEVTQEKFTIPITMPFYLGRGKVNADAENSTLFAPMTSLFKACGASAAILQTPTGNNHFYAFDINNAQPTVALVVQNDESREIHSAKSTLSMSFAPDAVNCEFNFMGITRSAYGTKRTLTSPTTSLGPLQDFKLSSTITALNEVNRLTGGVTSVNLLSGRVDDIQSVTVDFGTQMTQPADPTETKGYAVPIITQYQPQITLSIIKGSSLLKILKDNKTYSLTLYYENTSNNDTLQVVVGQCEFMSGSEGDADGLMTEEIVLKVTDIGVGNTTLAVSHTQPFTG